MALNTNAHLVLRLKKEYNYISTPSLGFHDLFRVKCIFSLHVEYIYMCLLPLIYTRIIPLYFKLHSYIIYQRAIVLRTSDIENTKYINYVLHKTKG